MTYYHLASFDRDGNLTAYFGHTDNLWSAETLMKSIGRDCRVVTSDSPEFDTSVFDEEPNDDLDPETAQAPEEGSEEDIANMLAAEAEELTAAADTGEEAAPRARRLHLPPILV